MTEKESSVLGLSALARSTDLDLEAEAEDSEATRPIGMPNAVFAAPSEPENDDEVRLVPAGSSEQADGASASLASGFLADVARPQSEESPTRPIPVQDLTLTRCDEGYVEDVTSLMVDVAAQEGALPNLPAGPVELADTDRTEDSVIDLVELDETSDHGTDSERGVHSDPDSADTAAERAPDVVGPVDGVQLDADREVEDEPAEAGTQQSPEAVDQAVPSESVSAADDTGSAEQDSADSQPADVVDNSRGQNGEFAAESPDVGEASVGDGADSTGALPSAGHQVPALENTSLVTKPEDDLVTAQSPDQEGEQPLPKGEGNSAEGVNTATATEPVGPAESEEHPTSPKSESGNAVPRADNPSDDECAGVAAAEVVTTAGDASSTSQPVPGKAATSDNSDSAVADTKTIGRQDMPDDEQSASEASVDACVDAGAAATSSSSIERVDELQENGSDTENGTRQGEGTDVPNAAEVGQVTVQNDSATEEKAGEALGSEPEPLAPTIKLTKRKAKPAAKPVEEQGVLPKSNKRSQKKTKLAGGATKNPKTTRRPKSQRKTTTPNSTKVSSERQGSAEQTSVEDLTPWQGPPWTAATAEATDLTWLGKANPKRDRPDGPKVKKRRHPPHMKRLSWTCWWAAFWSVVIPPLGMLLGLGALVFVNFRRKRGRGLAWAGFVIGTVLTIAGGMVVAYLLGWKDEVTAPVIGFVVESMRRVLDPIFAQLMTEIMSLARRWTAQQ